MYVTYDYERDDLDGNRGVFLRNLHLEPSVDWVQIIWYLQDTHPEWYYEPELHLLPSKVEAVLLCDGSYYNCIIDTEAWELNSKLNEFKEQYEGTYSPTSS